MNFWESLGIALIPTFIAAVISGFVSYSCAKAQNKSEIEKIEINQKKQLESDTKLSIYNIKKEAIFESLTIIDIYLSWLKFNNNLIPCRQDTTILDITVKARQCFNNLCLTCSNEKLINLFGEIFFKKDSNILQSYAKYRNEARIELEMERIQFNEDVIFISRISTKDLENYKN